MTLRYTTATTAATVMDATQLASLAASGISTVTGAISNDASGEFDIYGMAEIVIGNQGAARSAGANISLYALPTIDGSVYPAATGSNIYNYLIGVVSLSESTTVGVTVVIPEIRLPASDFKLALKNDTGQAFTCLH